MKEVEFLIVGQGIAGSSLALKLLQRGRTVMVLDRQDDGSSSRVAAGLVTPLTGKGMNPAWRQAACLEEAEHFYSQLEKASGRKFFHHQPVVRLFSGEKEQQKWERKKTEVSEWAKQIEELPMASAHGAIQMDRGAWLDTKVFLRVVRETLEHQGSWMRADFREEDVNFHSDEGGGLQWKEIKAKQLILCQGAYGLGAGGWFGQVPHRSAKGEVLTVWLDGLDESKRYHCNGWIAPRGGGVWKAGANYNWEQLDSEPSDAGKEEVLAKLKQWVPVPIEVIGHAAGVRPIIRNSLPVIGHHPDNPSLGFFNGLGSKGTLMAPAVASHFCDYLCGDCEIDPELRYAF